MLFIRVPWNVNVALPTACRDTALLIGVEVFAAAVLQLRHPFEVGINHGFVHDCDFKK